MVMTIQVMSSGKGYEYLLKSVVVGDGDREMSSPLTRYYTESGCPPGSWVGTGLMSLDDGRTPALAEGDTVTEEHLARLLGDGIHPVTGGEARQQVPLAATPHASGLRPALHDSTPTCAARRGQKRCSASVSKKLRRSRAPPLQGSTTTTPEPPTRNYTRTSWCRTRRRARTAAGGRWTRAAYIGRRSPCPRRTMPFSPTTLRGCSA